MADVQEDDSKYRKKESGSAEGPEGEIVDCWAVLSRHGEFEEVIAYVDSETMADLLLERLSGGDGPFEPAQEY